MAEPCLSLTDGHHASSDSRAARFPTGLERHWQNPSRRTCQARRRLPHRCHHVRAADRPPDVSRSLHRHSQPPLVRFLSSRPSLTVCHSLTTTPKASWHGRPTAPLRSTFAASKRPCSTPHRPPFPLLRLLPWSYCSRRSNPSLLLLTQLWQVRSA